MPPTQRPLRLEAAISSRMRSEVTSRSNWANDSSTFNVNLPMDVVVLNCWVTASTSGLLHLLNFSDVERAAALVRLKPRLELERTFQQSSRLRTNAASDAPGSRLRKLQGPPARWRRPPRKGGNMISFSLNNQQVAVDADTRTPLLWAIRDHIGLTGTKYGCGA